MPEGPCLSFEPPQGASFTSPSRARFSVGRQGEPARGGMRWGRWRAAPDLRVPLCVDFCRRVGVRNRSGGQWDAPEALGLGDVGGDDRLGLAAAVVGGDVLVYRVHPPRAIGGRGVAAELMRAALKVAAERGWSINPACSYAAAYMRKHAQALDKGHMDDLLDEALDESFPASDSPSVGGST